MLKKIEALRGRTIPNDVEISITRNYGETAAEKSNELLLHMGIAVIGVSLLILLTLGWRESGIVAIAIPSTLALTLLVFYLYGYTLNRITLFALIFSSAFWWTTPLWWLRTSCGISICRKTKAATGRSLPWKRERVGNPTILATFAVIAAVLPMARGRTQRPYMRPIPSGQARRCFFAGDRLHRDAVGFDSHLALGQKYSS